jgi:hypothetical protein
VTYYTQPGLGEGFDITSTGVDTTGVYNLQPLPGPTSTTTTQSSVLPQTTCPRNYVPNGSGGCRVVCKAGFHPDAAGKYCYPDEATQPTTPTPAPYPTPSPVGCPPGSVDLFGFGCVPVDQSGAPIPTGPCPAGQSLDPFTGTFCVPQPGASSTSSSAGWWPSAQMPNLAVPGITPGTVPGATQPVPGTKQPIPTVVTPSPAAEKTGILQEPLFWVGILAAGLVALAAVSGKKF